MVKIRWIDKEDGRHVWIDDNPEIIMGGGNLSYKEVKNMSRRDEGLNIAVKIVAFFCLCFFSILMAIKLIQYIFSGGF